MVPLSEKFWYYSLIRNFCGRGDGGAAQGCFPEYWTHCVPATRKSKFGKASEGSLFAVRNKVVRSNSVKFCKRGDWNVINLVINRESIIIFHIYINPSKWEATLETLYEGININTNQSYILMGDLNCRIGHEQILKDFLVSKYKLSPYRASRDGSVNRNGIKFIH